LRTKRRTDLETDRQMDGLTVYHLSRRERFYGDLVSPVKTQPWLRGSSCLVPNIFFPPVLIKFGFFSGRFLLKVPTYKFDGNPFSGSRSDTCGRTDRWMDIQIFVKSPHLQIWRKSVHWGPLWYMRTDGRTDRRIDIQIFVKSLHLQIWRKSVQWEPLWYMRTDGQTDGHTDFC